MKKVLDQKHEAETKLLAEQKKEKEQLELAHRLLEEKLAERDSEVRLSVLGLCADTIAGRSRTAPPARWLS